jgi:hypothetical protein
MAVPLVTAAAQPTVTTSTAMAVPLVTAAAQPTVTPVPPMTIPNGCRFHRARPLSRPSAPKISAARFLLLSEWRTARRAGHEHSGPLYTP